ncbi:o-succinylbenzoate synthase [Candidatus Formimonas warabiya]|uniref:o-succinylbenzoate synthase n=2 Tax=Formimonas warabiya TaxID=1761012 RepID=A0A3G1L1U1_FORW1|nr:o-succinylbenzoate synthase [Candidatus Formimonas warabiya]
MELHSITLRAMLMRMRHPFTTSLGTEWDKYFILVEARDKEGRSGWGESVASREPYYNEETVSTNWSIMKEFLIPLIWAHKISHPQEIGAIFRHIRRNNMAKAALDGALWDLYAKRQGLSLSRLLGGEKKEIEVGISIGIQETAEKMVEQVEKYVEEGYRRIKVKIQPGDDIPVVAAIRRRFPDIRLMVDANSAYTLADLDHLAQLDQFNLMMIEQPLAHDDIIDHATFQKRVKTPICLDESIHSREDARKAIELGSCKIINIKIGRVGGLGESKAIHDLCQEKGIPVWCGGMCESGIGRGHNVAITTLSGFTLPGDTAASSRYWVQDLIDPEVMVEKGLITVPQAPGIGYDPVARRIDECTLYSEAFRP